MAQATEKLLIVDPLTLIGRELLQVLEGEPALANDICYRHTSSDDEHQITELGGNAALVPPLDVDDDELVSCTAVLVASDAESPRLRAFAELLANNTWLPAVDVGGTSSMKACTSPASGLPGTRPAPHARSGHPSLVALATLAAALAHLHPLDGSLAAVDPVSSAGTDAIEALARQAAMRLQGGTVEELIRGHLLAFNLVAVPPGELAEEAAILLPDLGLSLSHSLGGCFHGHVAHIALRFADELDEATLRDALSEDARLELVEPPLTLDSVTESDRVCLVEPMLSRDRRMIAATLMADGLRIGGARTAVDILRSLVGA